MVIKFFRCLVKKCFIFFPKYMDFFSSTSSVFQLLLDISIHLREGLVTFRCARFLWIFNCASFYFHFASMKKFNQQRKMPSSSTINILIERRLMKLLKFVIKIIFLRHLHDIGDLLLGVDGSQLESHWQRWVINRWKKLSEMRKVNRKFTTEQIRIRMKTWKTIKVRAFFTIKNFIKIHFGINISVHSRCYSSVWRVVWEILGNFKRISDFKKLCMLIVVEFLVIFWIEKI